jgi:hypothetical protein
MNSQNEVRPTPKRLYSLDALRGFDMFWIIGGEGDFCRPGHTDRLAVV